MEGFIESSTGYMEIWSRPNRAMQRTPIWRWTPNGQAKDSYDEIPIRLNYRAIVFGGYRCLL
jgi:hypothetical protein